jgi:hypothetical protein
MNPFEQKIQYGFLQLMIIKYKDIEVTLYKDFYFIISSGLKSLKILESEQKNCNLMTENEAEE